MKLMINCFWSLITVGIGVLIFSAQTTLALEIDEQCADVETVFARGSGEGLEAREYIKFRNEIKARIEKNTIKVHQYELGTEVYDNSKYQR